LEEGSVVVNSKIFRDIVRMLPNALIDIVVKDNNINIICENTEFNLVGNPANEFPELPTLINQLTFSVPRDLFKDSVRQTVFATTEDETRPILTGVLLEIVNGQVSF